MRFMTIDGNGFPTAFYSEDIHGPRQVPVYGEVGEDGIAQIVGSKPNPDTRIPAAAIEISDDQWSEFVTNAGARKWQNGKVVTYSPAPLAPTPADVDAERDRRTGLGFSFGGKLYQARDKDIQNINGASTAAAVAIMNGSLPGDLRWSDATKEFGWIAADNSIVIMDAQTVIQFGQTAMAWVTAMTMAGRSIKDRLLAGEKLDITKDALWPDPTA